MKPTTILISLVIFLGLFASACAATQEPATPIPSPLPAPETATPTPEPIQVLEFDGFTVSLTNYHWEDDKLVTEFSFFNDRPKKNESMMIYAYDQDGNRISAEWPIMSAPILWPGETRDKAITWQCGPRSTTITIHLDDCFQDAWTKKSLTITR